MEHQLVAQSASHSRLHAGLTQAGLDTRNLAQEQQRLQRELRESVTQTERLGRELAQSGKQSNGFQGAIGSLTGRLVALADGAEAIAWIQQFAKDTPLQLDEVTQVFVRLKAFGIDRHGRRHAGHRRSGVQARRQCAPAGGLAGAASGRISGC